MTGQRKKIKECLEVANKIFDEGEIDFIESIQNWTKNGRMLTPKQVEWLEKLYKKACESPY